MSARVHELEHGGWTRADHFAADQVEWQAATYRAVLAPYVKRLPKPLVIKRPGHKPKAKKSWIKEWATAASHAGR